MVFGRRSDNFRASKIPYITGRPGASSSSKDSPSTTPTRLAVLFLATVPAGLAENYFLYPMGLDWLLPAMFLTAVFLC
jgi:hypothetical protein